MVIRISAKDKAIHKDLVRKTKAKKRRLEKKFGKDNISPLIDHITTPSIESFTSRKEFNAWKSQQKKFTNRNVRAYQFVQNDSGTVLSKKEVSKMKRNLDLHIKRIRKENKRLSKLPFIQGGKLRSGTVGDRMGMAREISDITNLQEPMPFNINRFQSREDVEERMQDLERFADPNYLKNRRATVKDNFITALTKSFNSDSEDLIEKIKNIDSDEFYEMFLMFDEINFQDFDSDGHGKDNTATVRTLERINNYIDRYENYKSMSGDLQKF